MQRIILGLLLGFASSLQAENLSLATAPLSITSGAEPNVMLLVDNSGSMKNLSYSADFATAENTATQKEWQYLDSRGQWATLHNNKANYVTSFFNRTGRICRIEGYDLFRERNNPRNTKCFKLPESSISKTTYISGAYINYLLNKFPDGTDFTRRSNPADPDSTPIPNHTRMEDAIAAGTGLLDDISGVKFGISRYNYESGPQGAYIDLGCKSGNRHKADVKNKLATYRGGGSTPLAEALYEITRYFRGMSSYYRERVSYTSPIEYRCQKSFTIAISDGFPTYDSDIPKNDPDDLADTSSALPDWDGLHPETTASQYPNFPQYSDGYANTSGREGATLYLDDIAKFGWDIDMRKTGNDADGKSFNELAFRKQRMHTYTVGLATDNQMLQDAADYGHGDYQSAATREQLVAALKSALNDIIAKSGTASAAAASTGSVQSGSRLYQARYNSANWSGGILAYDIETDRTSRNYGEIIKSPGRADGAAWDAGELIPHWDSRTIFSNAGAAGRTFRWDKFTPAEKTSFFNDQQSMIHYLRGRNTSGPGIDVSGYRKRTVNLGDVVSSSPIYIGGPSSKYPDTLESASYSAFVAANKSRTPMVYVGANDGMLHGFDAQTGVEKLAFIPSAVLPNLKHLANLDYNNAHRYYVDGTPTITDAYVNGAWKTILIGGLNGGGQSIYALDITDPSKFSESDANAQSVFMWEFTDADLGYTYSRPRVIKLADGQWYVAFGSGYNSTEDDGTKSADGVGYVYLLNIADGSLKKKLSTGKGLADDPATDAAGAPLNRPNGIPNITPVDFEGDYITDYIYTGDLFGNVWKFDVSSSAASSWDLDYRLFQACGANSCRGDNVQPITTAVIVGPIKQGATTGPEAMVYVGTGKYLESTDNNGVGGGLQSVYGLRDKVLNRTAPIARSSLLEQTITYELEREFKDDKGTSDPTDDEMIDRSIRVSSANAIAPTHNGWYIDLKSPVKGEQGERVVSDMTLRRGRLTFISSIPELDTCKPAGDLWFFDFDAYSGSRLEFSPFDNNNDKKYTKDDYATAGDGLANDTVTTARKLPGGGSSTELTFMIGSGGGGGSDDTPCSSIAVTGGLDQIFGNCGPGMDRQRWQQLYRN